MLYQCKKCNGKSKSDVRCSLCGGVFLVPPQPIEESTVPEPKVEAVPILKSPTYSPSKGGTKTVTVAPTRNLVNDNNTKREFSGVVAKHHRAKVGKDTVSEGTNGPGTNGPTSKTQTPTPTITSPKTEPRDGRGEGGKEVGGSDGQTKGVPKEEIKQGSDGVDALVQEGTLLIRELFQAGREKGVLAPYATRIKNEGAEKNAVALATTVGELKEMKDTACNSLALEGTHLIRELAPTRGKEVLTPYALRLKSAATEKKLDDLATVVRELKEMTSETGSQPSIKDKTEEKPRSPGTEELKRQEENKRKEEERKRKEEEERKRKEEEELANKKKQEIVELVQGLHADHQGTFAADAGKAATRPIDLGRLDAIKVEVEKKIAEVAKQAREKKTAIDLLLQGLHADNQGDFPARAANALDAKPIDLKTFGSLEVAITNEINNVKKKATELKNKVDVLLKNFFPANSQPDFGQRAAVALDAKPIDLKTFDSLGKGLAEAIKTLQTEANKKKLAIDKLLEGLSVDRHGPFPAQAADALKAKPIDLTSFDSIEREIKLAIAEVKRLAEEKKTAIDLLLQGLAPDRHGQFPARAANALNAKPIVLGAFATIEEQVKTVIAEVKRLAEEKKTAIDLLLQGLPPDRHGQFPTLAANAVTTSPIVLGTFTTIEEQVRAAIAEVRRLAELEKTAIDELLQGLPEQQRPTFSGQANQLLLATPIDLNAFAPIKQAIREAITRLSQPLEGQIREKVQNLTNSEQEREALLRLPPKAAQNVADLLETLAQQGVSAGRPFASMADAKVALREADQKIAEAPLKQFNAFRAAIRSLAQELLSRGSLTEEYINGTLNNNLTIALNNFNNVSAAGGLNTLQQIWDMLKNRTPEATEVVQQGETWRQHEAEQRAVVEAEAVRTAARPLVALEGSIRFGPLSRLVDGKPSEEDTAKIIQAYKDNPELADYALDLAQKGAHPEVVARGLEVVGAVAKTGFEPGETPDKKRARMKSALELGCTLGGDYFERMEAYYKTAAPSQPNALNVPGTPEEKGLSYTRALAGKLLDGEGGLDFARAGDVLNALHFHPSSLDNPLPALVTTVEDFRKEVATRGEEYNQVLNGVDQPTKQTSIGLVRKTLGKTGPVSAKDAKTAVLSAMLTPLAQGKVGSCHVTSPCIKFRANDPLGVMKDLTEVVKNGTLVKGGRPPVPVVTNIADKENTLLRSWEYTVATAGVRLTHNDEKKKLTDDLFVDYTGQNSAFNLTALQSTILPPLDWMRVKQGIQDELSTSFDYKYNPNAVISGGTASDGSSTEGKWDLMLKGNPETVIRTEIEYKNHMKTVVARALRSAGVRDNSPPMRKVDQIVDSPQFSTNLGVLHPSTKGPPWNKSAGGVPTYENEVLFGGTPRDESLYVRPSSTSSPSEKTAALLSGIAGKLLPPIGTDSDKDPKKDLVTLRARGVHAMNGLPSHPSLEPLRGANATEVQQKVQELLVDRGREIATTPVPPDRLNYLYDKALGSAVGDFFDGNLEGFTGEENRPTAEMTPAQFKQSILNKAAPKIRAMVERNLSVNIPAFTETTLRQLYVKQLTAKIDAFLLKELDYPEFVFADTNWGDPSERTLLVMAPDPSTGEPKMWKKEEFSGEYSLADPAWLDLEWSAVQ